MAETPRWSAPVTAALERLRRLRSFESAEMTPVATIESRPVKKPMTV